MLPTIAMIVNDFLVFRNIVGSLSQMKKFDDANNGTKAWNMSKSFLRLHAK